MLVGFYLLAICLMTAFMFAVVAVLEVFIGELAGAKLLVLAVPGVLAIGYGILFRTAEVPPLGLVLTESEQPRLWALAREIAATARTKDVDEIRLVPDANAAVTDTATWLGLSRGTRRMYVGVPLLLALDEPQMRSVIAHEFGHYSGRHTHLVGVTYRGAESIRRILSQVGRHNPFARVLRLYGQLYFAISRSVNRRQELEADQLGAQVAGAEVMASALLETRPAATAWGFYCKVFSGMGMLSGRRPDAFLAGFAEFLDDPRVVESMAEVRGAPETEQPSVYDTHPPISRRVAAIGVTPPVDRVRRGWAVGLLDRPDETLADLERELYDASLIPTPMDVLAPLAADDATHRHVRLVDDVLESQGRAPGLRTVMSYLGNGMSRELVRRELTDEVDEERLTELTADILGGYVAAALLDAGQATHRLDWRQGWVLVDAAGEDLDVEGLVREVMAEPSRAADLDELLRLSGVRDGYQARPHAPTGPRTPDPETSRILGIVSPVNRKETFVVHDDGLVLLAEKDWKRLPRTAGPPSVLDLLAAPSARHIAWDSVTRLTVVQLAGGKTHVFCEVDAELTVVVKTWPGSGEAGEPFAAMRHLLGDRYRTEERVGTRV